MLILAVSLGGGSVFVGAGGGGGEYAGGPPVSYVRRTVLTCTISRSAIRPPDVSLVLSASSSSIAGGKKYFH